MTEPRKCPLCGLGDPALFWVKVWDNPEARVFRCGACETLFLWPQLLGEKLASYYENYGEHLKKRTGGERITPDETLRRTAPHVRYRIETAKPFLSGVKRLLEVGGGSGNFIGPVVRGLSLRA